MLETFNQLEQIETLKGFVRDCFAHRFVEEINRRGEEAQWDDKPGFHT